MMTGRGTTEVKHPGHPYYFMIPGGQVFTIAPNDLNAAKQAVCPTMRLSRETVQTVAMYCRGSRRSVLALLADSGKGARNDSGFPRKFRGRLGVGDGFAWGWIGLAVRNTIAEIPQRAHGSKVR
jgi:hypothetical protein